MLESWGLHWALVTPCSQHYLLPLARQVNIHRPGTPVVPASDPASQASPGPTSDRLPRPQGAPEQASPHWEPDLQLKQWGSQCCFRAPGLEAHSLSPPPASLGCPAEPQHHFLLHGCPSSPGLPDRSLTPDQHWSDGQGGAQAEVRNGLDPSSVPVVGARAPTVPEDKAWGRGGKRLGGRSCPASHSSANELQLGRIGWGGGRQGWRPGWVPAHLAPRALTHTPSPGPELPRIVYRSSWH